METCPFIEWQQKHLNARTAILCSLRCIQTAESKPSAPCHVCCLSYHLSLLVSGSEVARVREGIVVLVLYSYSCEG